MKFVNKIKIYREFINCLAKQFHENCVVYSRKRIIPLDPAHVDETPIFEHVSENKIPKNRLYTFGLAVHGALGCETLLYPKALHQKAKLYMHKPLRNSFAEFNKIKDLACGYSFTILSVSQKVSGVYGAGLNTDGQIGIHSPKLSTSEEIIPSFRYIELMSKTAIVSLSAGRAHAGAVSKEGVYLWGNNAYGQCGRPVIIDEDYRHHFMYNHIEHINGKTISQIICGQDHSMFLTDDGCVYSCGWGADGQLGNESYQNSSSPSCVVGDILGEKIVKLSCAGDCILALNDKGDIFGWGNSEYGQLSIVTDEQQLNISKYLPFKSIGKVIDIAVGGTICMVLNEYGQVFVWGFGILGKGPNCYKSTEPLEIPLTLFGCNDMQTNTQVVSIEAGLYHQCAINNRGDLFTWGRNKYGCLGLGINTDQYFPLKVAIPSFVKKVACGVDHTVALCHEFV